MRAAVLHGPGDLRVEELPEPEGEVLVEVRAATAGGADREQLSGARPAAGPLPAPMGREMAGVRADSGERVLVGDSVACGACAPCLAGRTNLCRAMTWIAGGFAERIAAPAAAMHPIPDGLPFAAAAMAGPLAAAIHAVGRGTRERDCVVLGGGTTGLMVGRLLVLDGREVTVVDPHPTRRAQADDLGARGMEHPPAPAPLVFLAAPGAGAWRDAIRLVATGGTAVVMGRGPQDDVALPARRLRDEEVDVRGAFHHTPGEVDEALALMSNGAVDHHAFAGPVVGLDGLAAALRPEPGAPASKAILDPAR